MDKAGILDPEIMCPASRASQRTDSILAEMAVSAARDALKASGQ